MFRSEEIIFILITGTFIIVILSVSLFLFFGVYQKKRFGHQLEKQQLKTQFSQTLLQSQLEIQEQTLQQLSRELHDNIGLSATLIKINLTTLKLEDAPAAVEKVEATKEITRQLIADIKSLSVSLGSDRITQTGFIKALETEVQRLSRLGLFTITFTHNNDFPGIENDKTVILYRMAQEVLNNMVKHSDAKQITVNLTVNESLFILAFSDDGDGFDVETKMQSGGAGLHNLYHRANLINAQLTIQSNPGSGTSITVQMPL
jgi:signal transduction histidine kinase